MYKSPEDILTNEEESILMKIRDTDRENCFFVGALANRKIARIGSDTKVTKRNIYQAISRCVGKSPRTVRYYAETEAFYPKEDQEAYEVLPFGHFVYAKRRPDWKEFLDFAMEHPSWSLDAVKAEYDEGAVSGSITESQKREHRAKTTASGVSHEIDSLWNTLSDAKERLYIIKTTSEAEIGADVVKDIESISKLVKSLLGSVRGLMIKLTKRENGIK